MISKRLPNKPENLMSDELLRPYRAVLEQRASDAERMEARLTGNKTSLADFAAGHEFFGLHWRDDHWIFREWAPNATGISLIGDFSGWRELPEFQLAKIAQQDVWEISLPPETLAHGMHYRLKMHWPDGSGDRIPAYAKYVVQDPDTLIFSAKIWHPDKPYRFSNKPPKAKDSVLIYESHIGMAQEDEGIGSCREFRENVLPRIVESGYDTLQLMAVMSHPYYGSFGYHVASFFSICALFGTPDEFKELVDAAHGMGLRVIIDLIHSHAVKNEIEGLAKFDGARHQYFHAGERGNHAAWDSLCFDYGKPEVLHFLLSNCRFWLDEYRIDGFRLDGVTSMIYYHHGLGHAFTSYDDYFGSQVDDEALIYLTLANKVIHQVRPDAITIAEDVSGMPGLAASTEDGGCGFDFRLAMGVTDYWFKLFDQPDENWSMSGLWHELTNRRRDEKTISYVECHDQAIVGGQTAIFRMIGNAMYDAMRLDSQNMMVERGIALHKMTRLATLATAANGYLNFMGNEFGHPEWVDFPRAGNNWSYKYARRQWSLTNDTDLRYRGLGEFDRAMLQAVKRQRIFNSVPQKLLIHDNDKIIVFERGGLLFFFNFHPAKSFADYAVEVLPGKYQLALNSDAPEFGGHARLTANQSYISTPEPFGDSVRHVIKLYLPCRTALALQKII